MRYFLGNEVTVLNLNLGHLQRAEESIIGLNYTHLIKKNCEEEDPSSIILELKD